jgi:hypothetical protein
MREENSDARATDTYHHPNCVMSLGHTGAGRTADHQFFNCRQKGAIDQLRGLAPTPMIIHCPKCHWQHVDRDEWATAEKAHKTHLCEHCGELFRVANIPTVGVEALP